MKWLQKYHADFLNGEGLREVIFLSGCEHQCEGCFNKESWDFNQGKEWNNEDLESLINELKKSYISGVTFTGGDPLYSYKDLIYVLKDLKNIKINEFLNFDIWVYTGFIFEAIVQDKRYSEILNYIDVLCDGPFIKSLHKNNPKKWVGSSNQRVIDIQKSLKEGKVIEIKNLYKDENNKMVSKVSC